MLSAMEFAAEMKSLRLRLSSLLQDIDNMRLVSAELQVLVCIALSA